MNGESLFVPAGVRLLLRLRCRAMANHIRTTVSEAPVKVFATSAFIALIWFALYQLFWRVFEYFAGDRLQSVIAIPLLFNFFFVALLVLLAFSNAILSYGNMFADQESAYLLSAPFRQRSTVALKYAESLFFSSWSLLLLGTPLMLAIARVHGEGWAFYPLFLIYFLAFIPIPGAIGLLLAWGIARFLPRSARRVLAYSALVALLVMVLWGLQGVRALRLIDDQWVERFFSRMSLIEAVVLPSTWVTRGIEAVIDGRYGDSIRYLVVLIANALFFSWVAVHLVAHGFVTAYDRASVAVGTVGRPAVSASGGFAGRLFFFLPKPARLIAAKDMRTFVRDPMQWSQLAILFGLMALYLLHTPRFTIFEGPSRWTAVVPFLNLTAISFILATFTSRFVFPMVSLEGHQLWLVGLLPISRTWILVAKFSFAMVVTLTVASAVTFLASHILGIGRTATLVHWLVICSVCYGLCGLAVGLGARLPMFGQRHAARIANGLGGTINLIASVMLISIMLCGMGYVTWRAGEYGITSWMDRRLFSLCALVALLGIVSGTIAMIIGARHIKRLEV